MSTWQPIDSAPKNDDLIWIATRACNPAFVKEIRDEAPFMITLAFYDKSSKGWRSYVGQYLITTPQYNEPELWYPCQMPPPLSPPGDTNDA